MKPVIGLSCYREQASWDDWTAQADLLPSSYARSVEAAGGLAMLLPPVADPKRTRENAAAVVARLDGLIITGGADVDPGRYAADPHPRTQQPRPDRDAWELALLDAAAEIGLPTLGICRGLQVMAVHAGGRLHQHLPDVIGDARHSPQGPVYNDTQVTVQPGSRVAGLVGEQLTVSCHHHQAVADHPGLDAVAHAANGVIEALESTGDRFWLGVQWHPEERDDAGLFGGLIRAARDRSAGQLGAGPAGSAPVTRADAGAGRSPHAAR